MLIVILVIMQFTRYIGVGAGTKEESRSEACTAKLRVAVCTIKPDFSYFLYYISVK